MARLRNLPPQAVMESNIVAGAFFFFFWKSGHFCPVITFVVMQEKIRIIKSDGAGCKLIVGKEGISPQPPFFFGFSQCLRITSHN